MPNNDLYDFYSVVSKIKLNVRVSMTLSSGIVERIRNRNIFETTRSARKWTISSLERLVKSARRIRSQRRRTRRAVVFFTRARDPDFDVYTGGGQTVDRGRFQRRSRENLFFIDQSRRTDGEENTFFTRARPLRKNPRARRRREKKV